MNRIIEGAKAAMEIAQGKVPAARMWDKGFAYVPESKLVAVTKERDALKKALEPFASLIEYVPPEEQEIQRRSNEITELWIGSQIESSCVVNGVKNIRQAHELLQSIKGDE